MSKQLFCIGSEYTRAEVQEILGVPKNVRKGGNWSTGYVEYEGSIYIFANVGLPGRTGHDYDNRWEGDRLVWFGRNQTSKHQPFVKKLLSKESKKLVFFRKESRDPFIYVGEAEGSLVAGYDKPVRIDWTFPSNGTPTSFTEEYEEDSAPTYLEGASKKVTVNKYERNPDARKKCLETYGYICSACELSMEQIYGEVAKELIHVHHLTPVSQLGEKYELNPDEDLRPVCPNCHAVIHRRNPPYSIDEVKSFMRTTLNQS